MLNNLHTGQEINRNGALNLYFQYYPEESRDTEWAVHAEGHPWRRSGPEYDELVDLHVLEDASRGQSATSDSVDDVAENVVILATYGILTDSAVCGRDGEVNS